METFLNGKRANDGEVNSNSATFAAGEDLNWKNRLSSVMTPLDIKAVNAGSPYRIGEAEPGTYVFQTKDGIVYSISFSEDMEIAGCQSYQFGINRMSKDYDGSDVAVSETILLIISEFFKKNNDILLYICDTTDGKEAGRNRLFLRWFRHSIEAKNFTIKTASTIVEGIGFYAAIIVKNSHPKLQNIIAEFEQVSANLTNK